MKKFIFLLIFIVNFGFCEPYEPFDFNKTIIKTDDGGRLDLDNLHKSVDNIYKHSMYYPLHFDNQKDKETARADLRVLLSIFDWLRENKKFETMSAKEQFYLDWQNTRLFVMAHNFDMGENFAKQADESYERLLKFDKNGKIRTEFADFLANSNRIERAESEFETAINEGSESAHYGLAIAYMAQNKKDKAIKELQIYISKFPNDDSAKKMLEIFSNSEVKINKK
ncbi:tetratricopeptide repeat protein [Campylobacter sp. VBCF_05 NA6]|uniref:tetratricopeptide repeat protein n=1 Tax=unclassified Campylobacter TaxID=2593542 RepID=UPI0022E9B4F8|nr:MULTISPECIES: tetratricopeptide repeat protein [unclassified Campylobacter]MDA3057175.1 tetratricopeptide repeat protein [Campylobacter sp. VBCF_04 NA7]MDA3059549.1 tetratricopeptide repeat protein [Campylobacter sp. VBCF_05 NA6]